MHRAILPPTFAAGLAAAAFSLSAQAQVPSARFACEPAAGRLRLDVTPEVARFPEPHGVDVAAYTRMVKTKPYPVAGQAPGYDSTELPAHDFVRRCTLAGARYVMTLRAHPFGTHALGQCGAALPSFDVTLLRNDKRLLGSLLLQDNCGATENSSMVGITGIVVDEHDQSLSLSWLASELDRQKGWPPQATLAIRFDELPAGTPDLSQRDAILAKALRAAGPSPASSAQ